ncbi:hypothetical protein [Entomobacter blattae]|uniref:Uncharacterized protein n=1 Tax=Entomobacter blattae TaxID=2762277 RepID=A0A7H1NT61_9PROT|nr:hypothetical protein [Entomobacter blattae]QNT78971.1 hypothetical protein JGUZn3_17540 [Entomobacter blattae]
MKLKILGWSSALLVDAHLDDDAFAHYVCNLRLVDILPILLPPLF